MNSIYHAEKIEDVFRGLSCTPQGLSTNEANTRLISIGPNVLPEKKKASLLIRFLAQFKSLLVIILFIAGLISLFFDRARDAYVIFVLVIVNAIIGFFQELRAERAIESLKKLVVVKAKALRSGEWSIISSRELVPGDIVSLEEGDKVPADGRIIEEMGLRVDESSLTGESSPVNKDVKILPKETVMADCANMVWMGTTVTGGTAKFVVTATAKDTSIGHIAHSVATIKEPKSFFKKRVDELAFTMVSIALASVVFIFLVGLFLRNLPLLDIFLFSVASLVSGVPEGLPAIITIVLALGAYRIAARRAIVRHLPSTETLSVITVIASDKTGTITSNAMTVRNIVLSSGTTFDVVGKGWSSIGDFMFGGSKINPLEMPLLGRLVHIAGSGVVAKLLKKDSEVEIIGDPTEAALLVLAEKAGLTLEHLENENKLVTDLPFERSKRFRARLVSTEQGKQIYAIGAFEKIVELATHKLDDKDQRHNFEEKEKQEILKLGEEMAGRALRVIGLAYRDMPEGTEEIIHDDVKNLTFVGMVGMIDPPREGVKEAIATARKAGIRVIMKTGDHKKTAIAIAKEIGMIDGGDTQVLTEGDLVKMSDKEFFSAVKNVSVFARVTPDTKLRITRALQAQGEIVAVTGDGVNDAPALRQADIGIAMGKSGTDVAREASELVLTDDNFATIIDAIEEGRIISRNVKQTSFYLVTTNIAEATSTLAALAFAMPLPLLPIHLLWMNVVTDGLPAIALASESRSEKLSDLPKQKSKRILSREVLPFLILNITVMVCGTLFLFQDALPISIEKARTVAFAFLSWSQLWNMWNMRSLDRSIFSIGLFSNRYVIISFVAGILLQFLVVEYHFFQKIFDFSSLGFGEWVMIIALSSLILWLVELYKLAVNYVNKPRVEKVLA